MKDLQIVVLVEDGRHPINKHLMDLGEGVRDVKYSYGRPIDSHRNKVVKEFLETDIEWLLMLDSDVIPPPDFKSMVDYDLPVVSGLIGFERGERPIPLVAQKDEDGYRFAEPSEYIGTNIDLIKVDAVGAACLLVNREVFEQLEEPWFEFKYDDYGDCVESEDYNFSRKAREEGFPLHVSVRHSFQHFKRTDLTKYAFRLAERDKRIDFLEQKLRENGIEVL